jgi:hypothetical protein
LDDDGRPTSTASVSPNLGEVDQVEIPAAPDAHLLSEAETNWWSRGGGVLIGDCAGRSAAGW